MAKQINIARCGRFLRLYGVGSVLILTAASIIFTGFTKLLFPTDFQEILVSHGLIPEPIAATAAWAVILAEIGFGASAIWLIAGELRMRLAAAMLASIFLAFSVYAGAMIVFPPPAPASCGRAGAGSDQDGANWSVIAGRNSAAATMLLLMIPAARQTRARCSAD